ncbi:CD209 antigen isoform X2 [Antechinus flavipes]|uniref:CD209 antigen isoform X2 n=1 Tax=Antechinus flavipes TaxID=38775 RepID=UPI002236683C|nr:CD209 antigen isoform X2 [Antechinus flavipes]
MEMCEADDLKSSGLAELDEDALMPSGWSNFNLRTQSLRRYSVSWLSRLGFLMMMFFITLSFILSIIILSRVFQTQSQYNLEHEAIMKKLSQLSAQMKDDWDLRAKENLEVSQLIEQLNNTLNLRAKEKLEVSQLIEQLNKNLNLRTKEKIEASQLIDQLNKTLNLRAEEQNEVSLLIKQLNKTLSTFCQPCPYKWELYKDSCYFFSVNQNSWEEAREACKIDGSDLVIVSSSEEQKYLKQKIDLSHVWWLGLSDKKKEGTWHWVDGTILEQSFWNEGEPNNAGDEDYCELTSKSWNDASCSKKNKWICEKEAFSCLKP